ncbi:transporter substrate-binding domain-containing protein [Parahaliea maris]|uniref:Transporter substrate-binding domain-containing protein n=1 Tax=Parahaliea maris TaxID=2716870 RepID=A0A5C8ZMN7_9GAMM|nr:transporter substrate-binding domain-containing protein [Parahaliea maris]
MQLSLGRFSITIRMTVVLIFMLATLLTAALAISLQYYFGRNLAREATTQLFTLASGTIATELKNFGTANASVVDLLADNEALLTSDDQTGILRSFGRALSANPLLYGIYIGRGDGSMLELVNLDSNADVRRTHNATPTDRWLMIQVEMQGHNAKRSYHYLNEAFEERVSRSEEVAYDLRGRSWYTEALEKSGEIARSDIYLFSHLGEPGRTLSKRVGSSDTVIAADYTLESISNWLREQRIAEFGDAYIYDHSGQLSASSVITEKPGALSSVSPLPLSEEERKLVESLSPVLVSNEMDWPPFDYALTGQPRGYSIDLVKLVAQQLGLRLSFINGLSWSELVEQFRGGDIDLLHSVLLTENNTRWGSPSDAYFSLPYAVVTTKEHPPLQSLDQLAGQQLAIPAGWSVIPVIQERYPRVGIVEVGSTLDAMKLVQNGEVVAALDNEVILHYIETHYFLSGLQYHSNISLGNGPVPNKLHMLVGQRLAPILPLLNRAIAAITPAQREELHNRWLNYASREDSSKSGVVPHDAMITLLQSPHLFNTLREVMHQGEPHYLFVSRTSGTEDEALYFGMLVPQEKIIGPFLDRVKLSIAITGIFLLLLLPLSWAFASPIVRPIRQLALENDKVRLRQFDAVHRLDSRVKEIDELSESMVAMVQAIQAHEAAQRELMDAFIRLIAQAIDDKSPYTGGHCERVPELALMLAEHASTSNLPAFRSFKLENRKQWREFRIAAWLHDCGKITTPEHVVDKGSKLETIYNRIHEVRTRFEVLWRDAEIDYLKRCLAQPELESAHREKLEKTREKLQDDFNFVAECNVGGEFLSEEAQARLRGIANVTWQRHFDNRIGLSPVEELRMPEKRPPLPATELLLANRPEHIIPRTRSTDYPPELGIDMDIPEHLYNLGELYNLSISRGTLTTEDRFKINEHMISTIKMLESLPFPDELKNVPRYASTHHETMKGTGYPRRLPGSELSIPERLLAVADVFEALTAADRPYKKAKPVSVAVDILHKMVEDNHIDRDSFELFIRDKVYLEYARKFLPPEQIDHVDTSKYLRRA